MKKELHSCAKEFAPARMCCGFGLTPSYIYEHLAFHIYHKMETFWMTTSSSSLCIRWSKVNLKELANLVMRWLWLARLQTLRAREHSQKQCLSNSILSPHSLQEASHCTRLEKLDISGRMSWVAFQRNILSFGGTCNDHNLFQYDASGNLLHDEPMRWRLSQCSCAT